MDTAVRIAVFLLSASGWCPGRGGGAMSRGPLTAHAGEREEHHG